MDALPISSIQPNGLLLLAWGSILALLLSRAAFAFPSIAVISSPAARVIRHGRNTVVVSAITDMPMLMRMSDSDGGPTVSDRSAETKEVVKDNDVDDKEEVDERTSLGGYKIRLLNQYSRNTTYMAVQDKILRKKGEEPEEKCYNNCDVSYFYVKFFLRKWMNELVREGTKFD